MIVDVVRAESSRFHHPLLMLHGLWTGGWIWRRFAAYLSHRGWNVWLPSLLEDGSLADAASRLQFLGEICRTLPAAPVIIGHDAGVALGVALAGEVNAPAVVAIAPVLPRIEPDAGLGVLAHPSFWGARLAARAVAPPVGRVARGFATGLGEEDVARFRPDSGAYFRALLAGTIVSSKPTEPGLVIASPNDDFSPYEQARRLADRWRWTLDVHETPGHFPMLTTRSEDLADRVHRWLVRAMGADLLAWIDDEEEAE